MRARTTRLQHGDIFLQPAQVIRSKIMSSKSSRPTEHQAVTASPFATGGYGPRYESAIDAYILALLIIRQPVVPNGAVIVRVGFQRGPQGALLDDVVLSLADGTTLQLSIKAGVMVQAANADFRETLERAWRVFVGGPEIALYGLVAPPTARGLDSLQRLVFFAGQHDDAAEFARIAFVAGTTADEHRDRFAAVRSILEGANQSPLDDGTFHRFLRRFRIVALDLNLPQSTHLASLFTALQGFQGIDQTEAGTVYNRLVGLAQDGAIAGGAIERAPLVRQLLAEGIPIGESRDYRLISDALRNFAARSREALREDVAGTSLDRSGITGQLLESTQHGRHALLTGPSGSGKSVILQLIYDSLVQAGPVLYLTGRRIEAAGSWQGVCEDMGIPPDRGALIELLATHPDGITIVIDALEHIVSPAARSAANDLLLACGEAQKRDLSPRLNLFVSTRDNSIQRVLRWLRPDVCSLIDPRAIDVLSDEDAQEIAKQSPRLVQLLARLDANPVTRNLLILRLLDDARIPESALPQGNASEIEMLQTWWEHVLFTDDAQGQARLEIVYRMAEAIANSSETMVVLQGVDSGAVAALVHDEIIVRDAATDRHRFTHDILQDWCTSRWLGQVPNATLNRLEALAHARYLQRPVSLVAQDFLERSDTRYTQFLSAFRAHPQLQRWYRAFVGAIAASTRSRSILQEREAELLEHEAALLRDLLVAMRTEYVDADDASRHYAESRGFDAAKTLQLALSDPMPRFLVWAPLLQFAVVHWDQLSGETLTEFMRAAEMWQRRTPSGFPLRGQIVDCALAVLAFSEAWRPHETGPPPLHVRYADKDEVETLARSIVADSFAERPADVREYLHLLASDGYHDDQLEIVNHSLRLSMDAPDELVEFALSVLIEHREFAPWELDMSEHGLVAHTFYPPSDLRGPFLALLSFHEDAGIRLVRELANHALAHDMRELGNREGEHLRPLQFDVAGTQVQVFANEQMYCWFRPYSAGSSVLTSALMALETWAWRAVGAGRDPREVLCKLLEGSRCAATLGIAVGLAYDAVAITAHLVDVIASPAVWRLEYGREKMDYEARSDLKHLLPPEFQLPSIAPEIDAHNKQRDTNRNPNRVMVRLSAWLLFLAAPELRDNVVALCSTKTVADACLYAEEAEDLDSAAYAHEQYRDFAAKVDLANFVVENGTVRWNPPAGFLPSMEQQQIQALRQAFLAAGLEAIPVLRNYHAPNNPRAFVQIGRLIDQAIREERIPADEPYAHDAMVRTAAVGLAFDSDLIDRSDDLHWCVETIRSAANPYFVRNWEPDLEDYSDTDIRRALATGIAAAYCLNPSDDLRELMFSAATAGLPEVGAAALRGILPLWAKRPSAALNIFGCLVRQALGARGVRLSDEERRAVIDADAREHAAPLPLLKPETSFSEYLMKTAFSAMPRSFSKDAALALRPLLESLIAAVRRRGDDHFDIALAYRLGSTAAAVLKELPSPEAASFHTLLTDWQVSNEFYAQMMQGFAVNHLIADPLAEQDLHVFERLCEPFLNADHAITLRKEHLPSGFQQIVQYLIFIEQFGPHVMPEQWPHAARFREHIARWVRAVGGHPSAFVALTIFLERFAGAFAWRDVLDWLVACRDSVTPALVPTFWAQSGERCAILLLRLLQRDGQAITNDSVGRERTLRLGSDLLAHGIAVGTEVRDFIDHINR